MVASTAEGKGCLGRSFDGLPNDNFMVDLSMANCKKFHQIEGKNKLDTWFTYWCVLRRVAGWVAGGCWDDD